MRGFLLLVFLFLYPCYAFDDGDFQYWNSESVETKFGKNCKIKVGEEFRFGDDASSFYYNHTDLGLSSSFNEHLEFSMNYRHIYEKKNKKWYLEYRPHINTIFRTKLNNFSLKDTNRFEYRIKENSDDSWRYRNKLSLDLPVKWTHFNIQPYIADEIFIDFDKEKLDRNRVYLGFKMKLLKNLEGEISYLWQSTKASKWKDCNVLGTSLNLVF